MSSEFSAASTNLGYLYQTIYALLLLLNGREETRMSLETLDDVVFEDGDNSKQLLQLKHHKNSTANLTNNCPDLWKTLRVWSSQILEGNLSLSDTTLTLVTTAIAPTGSISALLKPGSEKDVKDISGQLTQIAKSSTNQSLEDAFKAFLALSISQREELVLAIQILDGSPIIIDLPTKIKNLLLGVRPKYREHVYERLEGWWVDLAIRHLFLNSEHMVSKNQVEEKIASINEQFGPDVLPIDFFDANPPDTPDLSSDHRQFVMQLKRIMVQDRRIEKAILDYYRAFQQRSKWMRDNLVDDREWESYEAKLIDEWDRFCLALRDEVDYDDTSDEKCIVIGKKVYNWMEMKANFPIRKQVTEEYMIRGSYHLLADKNPPGVWWHPKFLEELSKILVIP